MKFFAKKRNLEFHTIQDEVVEEYSESRVKKTPSETIHEHNLNQTHIIYFFYG